jgi:hypothetical protein
MHIRSSMTALVIVASACASSARTLAEQRLHCPANQIQYERHNQTTLIEGCDRDDVIALLSPQSYAWSSLRERVGADFSCDPQDINIDILDDATFRVEGCGKQATYTWVPRVGFVPDFLQSPSPSK